MFKVEVLSTKRLKCQYKTYHFAVFFPLISQGCQCGFRKGLHCCSYPGPLLTDTDHCRPGRPHIVQQSEFVKSLPIFPACNTSSFEDRMLTIPTTHSCLYEEIPRESLHLAVVLMLWLISSLRCLFLGLMEQLRDFDDRRRRTERRPTPAG